MSKPIKKQWGHLGRGKPGKCTASAKTANTQKPCQYTLAETSGGGEDEEKMSRRKKRCCSGGIDRFIYYKSSGIWPKKPGRGGGGGAQVKPLVGMLSVGDLRSAPALGRLYSTGGVDLSRLCASLQAVGVLNEMLCVAADERRN